MVRWFYVIGFATSLWNMGCASNINGTGSSLRAAAGDDQEIAQGEAATLSGSAAGGTPPYIYRWSLNSGSDVEIPDPTLQDAPTTAFTLQGRYVFRLVVTDAADRHDEDYVEINVGEPDVDPGELSVSIDAPGSLQSLEAGTLTANASGAVGDLTYLWEVVDGEAELTDATSATATVTTSAGFEGTLRVRVTVTDSEDGRTASSEAEIDVTVGEFSVDLSSQTGVLGELNEVRAAVTGVSGDIDYDWVLVSGPTGTGMGQANCPNVWVLATRPDEVVVQLNVLDRESQEILGTDEITIPFEFVDEEEAITVTIAPDQPIAQPSEEVTLAVEIEGNAAEESFSWSVVSGAGTLDDPTASTPVLTPTGVGTVHVRLDYTATGDNGEEAITKDVYVSTAEGSNPQVVIDFAGFGEVTVELNADAAPIAVANFLSYVDEGFYDGLVVHRAQPNDSEFAIARVDAGGFDQNYQKPETHDQIVNENPNGLSHVRGTIAAAQDFSGVDTATSSFFINVTDNGSSFDAIEEGGFLGVVVFGEVVEGMDVIDAISEVETDYACGDFRFDLAFAPVETIVIESVRRVPAGEGS